jgi:hypothetical protein
MFCAAAQTNLRWNPRKSNISGIQVRNQKAKMAKQSIPVSPFTQFLLPNGYTPHSHQIFRVHEFAI